ncbi:MAG: hypothetical protein AB8I08_13970 [Sandaracinaceae bacterium]
MKRALIVASLLAVAGCAAPDLLEPEFEGPGLESKTDGFSSIEASHLNFGEEATAEFDRDFQYFAYEFEAREDAVIQAEVTQRGSSRGLDTTMFLYRLSDGAEPSRIGSDDDGGWGALSEVTDFRLFSEGLYAIVVGTKDAAGRGNFRLTLSCLSGDCAPETPAEPICADDMRRSIRECMDEVSYENDYSVPMNEVAADCTRDLDLTFEYHCDGADAPEWCFRGEGTVIRACEAHLRTTYPADSLSGRVTAIDTPDFDELADAAHMSEGCGVGPESGCTVSLSAFNYTGDRPSLQDIFAYVRSRSEIGPGAGLEIEASEGAVEGLAETYEIETPLLAQIGDLGVNTSQVEEGFMFQHDISWNFGDCQIDVAVMHDASSRTVVVFDSLFCAG